MSIIELKNITKTFDKPYGGIVTAVDDVSLALDEGECLGIIGESGSGKSTLGRIMLRLQEPDEGEVFLEGINIRKLGRSEMRRNRHRWQIVFQEPFASLNPRMTVAEIVEEPLIVSGLGKSKKARLHKVSETLFEAGLSDEFLDRRPANLSGGQQQRVGIARALVTDPALVVLDEPTASLDLTVRAAILRMLKRLQQSRQLTYVFISHDIETVRHFSTEVMVMHHGRFVEKGTVEQVLSHPKEDYTKNLMAAAMPPIPYKGSKRGLKRDVHHEELS